MTGPIVLSIVIVNWNVRALLRACLLSLRNDNRDTWEVIVVDNASADDSAAMLRAEFPEITLIESATNLGFAAGCQLGFEHSRGEYVLLLNPDTEVPPGAIEQMLTDLRHNERAAILGSRLTNRDGGFQRASGGAFPTIANVAWNYLFLNVLLPARIAPPAVYLVDDPQGIFEVDWVSGAALLFRRAAIGERIFDPEYFMFGEDMALCARVRRQGWTVLYSTHQSILHHHGQSYRQQSSLEILGTIYKGPRTFFRANHGPLSVIVYDAVLLLGYLLRWILATILRYLRPNRGYDEMARFSRNYVGVIVRSMLAR
jgi:N-acetylglucosaminyl-diphospho-decaprenol L-rhamnosyltransferase